MKSFLWLLVGVGLGFVVAHRVNETQKGREFFSSLDQKARDFGEAVSDGYRQREAELRSAIGD
ncbi:hypothetical protein P5G50_13585 [Leifsonia sp. F6_8S_P_1B]|uniref:Secreted protein n=1 Tax=Leifsonia williamsii TaxID=3035919 RepID=A0ABT8KFA3_9MICO|nr:hypothetical protein [Leifsonia williamsii]MDN4615481.1 hypothetical protein [Leifsonia williamsii]